MVACLVKDMSYTPQLKAQRIYFRVVRDYREWWDWNVSFLSKGLLSHTALVERVLVSLIHEEGFCVRFKDCMIHARDPRHEVFEGHVSDGDTLLRLFWLVSGRDKYSLFPSGFSRYLVRSYVFFLYTNLLLRTSMRGWTWHFEGVVQFTIRNHDDCLLRGLMRYLGWSFFNGTGERLHLWWLGVVVNLTWRKLQSIALLLDSRLALGRCGLQFRSSNVERY